MEDKISALETGLIYVNEGLGAYIALDIIRAWGEMSVRAWGEMSKYFQSEGFAQEYIYISLYIRLALDVICVYISQ